MAATTTDEQIQSVVFDALVELGPSRDELSREATFEALDVDSLDLAELSQVIEEHFGVRLKGDDVSQIKTVGDLLDLLAERTT